MEGNSTGQHSALHNGNATIEGNSTGQHDALHNGNATMEGNSTGQHSALYNGNATMEGNSTGQHGALHSGNATREGNSTGQRGALHSGNATMEGNSTDQRGALHNGNTSMEGESTGQHNALHNRNANIEGDSTGQHSALHNTDATNNIKTCSLDRILSSICLILMFIAFGCLANLLGTCLVHLGLLFNENVTKMAFTFTFWGIGYIIGSIGSGVIFDRFDPEGQFFIVAMFSGLLAISATWAANVYWFYAAVCLFAICMSYLDSCGQPYCIRLWTGHRYKNSIVQMMYATQTLGTFIGPFTVRPFLVELPQLQNINRSSININNTDWVITSSNSSNCMDNQETPNILCSTTTNHNFVPGIDSVRYPFIINGVAMCMVSITFLITFGWKHVQSKINLKQAELSKVSNLNAKDREYSDKTKKDIIDNEEVLLGEKCLVFKTLLLVMLFMFMFSFLWCIIIPTALFTTFVIRFLHWKVNKAPLVAAIYTGGQVLGRLIAIPLLVVVRPSIILTFNLILTMSGSVLMLFVTMPAGDNIMWVSTAMVGLGTSTTFPAILLWTSGYMHMTGRVGSVFFVGGSVGGVIAPTVAGYMFDNYSPMWMVYISLLAAICNAVFFLLMVIFVKCYKVRKSEKSFDQVKYQHEVSELETLSNCENSHKS